MERPDLWTPPETGDLLRPGHLLEIGEIVTAETTLADALADALADGEVPLMWLIVACAYLTPDEIAGAVETALRARGESEAWINTVREEVMAAARTLSQLTGGQSTGNRAERRRKGRDR